MLHPTTQISCACGQVQVQVQGAPIISAECHCKSCRDAAARLQTLDSAPAFLVPNGATPFVLYRKDRVQFIEGTEHLKEFRLSPKAKTRRIVACCCNTPVMLEFSGGHWLSLYSCLWPESIRPKSELRTMTMDRNDASPLPDDIPKSKRQSFSFMAKLLGAWIAMGFRNPKITFVQGTLKLLEMGASKDDTRT